MAKKASKPTDQYDRIDTQIASLLHDANNGRWRKETELFDVQQDAKEKAKQVNDIIRQRRGMKG